MYKKQKIINTDRPKLIKHIKLQEIFIAAYHQVLITDCL